MGAVSDLGWGCRDDNELQPIRKWKERLSRASQEWLTTLNRGNGVGG